MGKAKDLTEKVVEVAKTLKDKLAQPEELEEVAAREAERAPDPKRDAGYFDKEGVFRRAR